MRKFKNSLNALAQQKDLLLIIVFVTILLMMIMPLPTFVMDLMITLNISIAIMVILMTLQLHNPVHFSTFPSLLLVTTLFRLAISISTTRLILIEGDAGKIVETFGNVVVGGNLVVGLVIFLIITVVQFLVITKGADRVAEVGARFTLDGMPGKQMSVDADVRAGSLDQFGAKEARSLLEREAKLFGAMDGAMKFVKGDAIAGLVITAINLLGGIAIGMAQLDMGFSEALGLYAILTIGDGLVAQIPALLISVSAGTMVTRVTNPKGIDLGSEIAEQITANHRTLMIAGLVIALFGFVPGFPTLIFCAIGLLTTGGIYWHSHHQKKEEAQSFKDWKRLIERNQDHVEQHFARTDQGPTVELVFPSFVTETDPQVFVTIYDDTRINLEQSFGVPMGLWTFSIDAESERTFIVKCMQEVIASIEVDPEHVFVRCNSSYLEAIDIPCARHFGVREGAVVSSEQISKLNENGIQFWDPLSIMIMETKRCIASNLGMFLGLQVTSGLLDRVAKSHPSLVSDLRETLSVSQISATLKLLVQERIPMTSLVRVFESILEWAPKRPEPLQVLQQVRVEIGDMITRRFASSEFLPAIVIAPSLESFIREGFRTTGEQSYLVIDSEVSQEILRKISPLATGNFKRGTDPVIVTQQDIRRPLHNLLNEHGIYIPVLGYQEISPATVMYPVDFINIEA